QSNNDVMQLGRAGKADRLAHQAFDPGAQREVLALYLLRVALARVVRIRLEMPRVGACVAQKYYPSLRDSVGAAFACRVSGRLLTIWHLTSDMSANQSECL